MSKPPISIITVSFQAAATIDKTLDSVRIQKTEGLEHLVQDGGSTDSTEDIVKSYPHARFIGETDSGIYDGLNKAIQNASGDIIGLLNADDFYLHESVISQVLAVFNETPDLLGVYGDLQYVRAEDTKRVVRHWSAGTFSSNKLRRGWMPPHPTLFLRREVYENVGLFDTRYAISADYDFMIRVFKQYGDKIEYLPSVLIGMRMGGVSNANLRSLLRKTREDLTIARRAGFFAPLAIFGKITGKLNQFRLPI